VIETDVLVIGAGPAGSAAAIAATRHGLDVVVVDKARFPRDKCCGDGLTTLGLRMLADLGFDPATVPNWFDVDDIVIRGPSGRETSLQLPRGQGSYAAVAPRVELDAALVQLAAATGARMHLGHAFSGFAAGAADGDRLAIEVDGLGTVLASHVIAADGMWSPVRKALGLAEPGYLGEWHAFRQYARHVTGPAATQLFVWFEADLLPGYAWSFPLPDGRANIGFGLLRTAGTSVQHMRTLWPELLARPHVRAALGEGAELEGRHLAWPIPARVDRATLAVGQVLFVGDAAAATDQLTGEGIGQALLTGIEAANAIAGSRAEGPLVAGDRYRASVRHHLVADHRMSIALSRVVTHPRAVDAGLRLVDSSDWSRRNFARWMFEDEPRAAALTPRRWHRRFLRLPGATWHTGRTPAEVAGPDIR
jgi:geranylgeranyl reductase family protein